MLLEHGADVENEVVLCNLHPPTEDTVNVKSVDTSRKNVKPGLQWRPLRQTSKATEEREACSLFQVMYGAVVFHPYLSTSLMLLTLVMALCCH